MSGAYWLRCFLRVSNDSTYTYSCQVCEGVGNGGSPRSPLRHTDSHHHRHHHHHRVSSARGLRSNFQTCLNDHRKWNVRSYYRPLLEKWFWRTEAKGNRHWRYVMTWNTLELVWTNHSSAKEIDQNEICVCVCVCVCVWTQLVQLGILKICLQSHVAFPSINSGHLKSK